MDHRIAEAGRRYAGVRVPLGFDINVELVNGLKNREDNASRADPYSGTTVAS